MIKYKPLTSALERQKIFDLPLPNHFSPVMQISQLNGVFSHNIYSGGITLILAIPVFQYNILWFKNIETHSVVFFLYKSIIFC